MLLSAYQDNEPSMIGLARALRPNLVADCLRESGKKQMVSLSFWLYHITKLFAEPDGL